MGTAIPMTTTAVPFYYNQQIKKPSGCVWELELRPHSGTSKYSSTQAQGIQARDRRAEAVFFVGLPLNCRLQLLVCA